jgi:hypothetical protein
MNTQAEQLFQSLEPLVALTADGQVAVLKNMGNSEDLIIACLVAQNLSHQMGKASKQTMSVDDLIAAGGLAHRLARQTVYNSTSALARSRIIQKRGNEFCVDERAILQFVSARLPHLVKER